MYRGTIRVREALQLSLNIPVVALTDALGPAKLLAALDKAGVQPVLAGRPAGAGDCPGRHRGDAGRHGAALCRPCARRRGAAADAGGWTATGAEGQRVLSDVAAWQVGDILAGLAPPPGAPANRLAYKTGTSYGHRDAWAIGFDGAHVIGVWMGRADGTPVPGAFGADLAAPVLFQAFNRLKPELDPQPPAPPATLLVSNAATAAALAALPLAHRRVRAPMPMPPPWPSRPTGPRWNCCPRA